MFVAKSKGVDAVYADPKEGYLLWAMAAYLTKNPNRSPNRPRPPTSFSTSCWAAGTAPRSRCLRGYMTNTRRAGLRQGACRRVPGRPERKRSPTSPRTSAASSAQGGTWQNRWPTQVDVYESEWARFKAA